MHGAVGRLTGEVLHDVRRAGRRSRGDDRGGPGRCGRPASGAGRVPGRARAPMRLLHARDDAGRRGAPGTQPRPDGRRHPLGDLGQHLSLHGLHEHRESAGRPRHRQGPVPGPRGRGSHRGGPVRREGRGRTGRRRLRRARCRGLPATGAGIGRTRDPGREGRADRQPHLPLGVRGRRRDGPSVRRRRSRGQPRHVLSAVAPSAARDLRLYRGRGRGYGSGDDLHDLASPTRDPNRVRTGRRAAGGEHPHRVTGPRRGVREQGARVPGVRGRDGGVAPARSPGQMDRGPLGEPHQHRLRARLPYARRARPQERRDDAGTPDLLARGRGSVPRRRAALEVQGWALPRRHRVLRHAGGTCRRRRLLHEQGARRRGVPMLVPGDRGVLPHRAPRAERRLRAGHGSGRPPEEELHPEGPVPVRDADRVRL